jgi:hypothetical protein
MQEISNASVQEQRLRRKIDQHAVMMGMALKDGDKTDALRHMEQVERLRAELTALRQA